MRVWREGSKKDREILEQRNNLKKMLRSAGKKMGGER